jgi:1-acyl-sn-glycerol-3-phosphate acyltransferase
LTIPNATPQDRKDTTAEPADVLTVVTAVVQELHPQRKALVADLDSSLERDLGLDSLGRVEVVQRLERTFGVRLPEATLTTAESPRDLWRAVVSGTSGGADLAVLEAAAPAVTSDTVEPAPARTRTLLEVLDWHVQQHADRRHILFYPGDGEPEEMTFGDLDRRSRAVAAGLRALGLQPRQSVGIMLPSGLDYFAAFFGVQRAGGIPVPLYPPARKSQIEDHLRRQAGILKTAESVILITFPEVLTLARLLRAQVPTVQRLTTVADLSSLATTEAGYPPVGADDVAFLQFTSGSTGNPKGVTLTHANLLANLRAIGPAVEMSPADVVVSWLPLYHDMGLIGSWMGSLYYATPLILMSPLTFLARPARWLQAIHRHRGTLSPAPNFAYELCVAKVAEDEITGLDLSSWRYALNGAEPVSPEAMRRFSERFAAYGFDPKALAPVYGLAENSLALAFTPLGRGPRLDAVERDTFQRTGKAIAVDQAEDALRFVSCGVPVPGHEIRVVDEAEREVGERQEGRIEFRGPSATSGYWRNPEATAALIRGEWLDSGDRGYIAEGEVHITGRVKDIIIRAGRNLYPQELEEAVGEIPGVRKGCVAVFGAADPATGTERLVVLAETRERDEAAREALREAIQGRAVDLLGAPADDVVLAPPYAVPKTSSGKIRRAASRELYEQGRIGAHAASVGWQLARLAGAGLRARAAGFVRRAGEVLYAGRFWGVFALAALPLWPLLVLTPGVERRRRLARRVARGLAGATGIRLRTDGLESLDSSATPGPVFPLIIAANHQSYLDAIVLTALLPPRFVYVVKKELDKSFATRLLLRGLGAIFVERFDPAQGAEETRKVLDAVRGGASLVIFPEGTFRRGPGLLPFRLGTFAVAAEAGVPVVPLVIRGTRSMLRGNDLFPRRGTASVAALPPVSPVSRPGGSGWTAAIDLRDAVRAAILERCGEPDLGG